MTFDKSLKLLNYAKNTGGFLQLYTELDHSFAVGDTLFIIGGIYDNTDELSYISSYSHFTPNSFNPFNSNKKGYAIKSVDYSTNSFVIDHPVTTLIYPYGILLNPFGDPQDGANLAYNTYTGTDLYKGIYVSKTAFLNGRFRSGTVNNGVFGNDTNLVRFNIHENQSPVKTDILMNHIVSKNTRVNAGILKSKTDIINPISTKMFHNEDNTLGIPSNPGAIISTSVSNNNNSYGYSLFERFNIFGNVDIYNGDFNNPRANFIVLDNYNSIKFRAGGKEPVEPNGIKLSNGTFNNVSVGNFTKPLGAIDVNNGTIDTFIDLKPISVIWGGNPGEIIFNVDYNVVANKNWIVGTTCYISGIKPQLGILNDSSIYDINFSFGVVQAVSYTTGSINSASITILFNNLVTPWVAFTAAWTTVWFDWTATKISMMTFDHITMSGLVPNVSTVIINTGMTWMDLNTTVKEGYYENIVYHAGVQFNGLSIGEGIYLKNTKQMYQSDVITNSVFNSVMINTTQSAIKGDFDNSFIIDGIVHNSTIHSCFVKSASNVYLYNVNITGSSVVDSNVKSDMVYYNGDLDWVTTDMFGIKSIISTSSFAGRKTMLKTGPASYMPIVSTAKISEFNKITGNPSLVVYDSQSLVWKGSGAGVTEKMLRYHVPSMESISGNLNAYVSIIDHGDMSYNSFTFWSDDISKKRNDVLFSAPLSSNVTLQTAIDDRTTYQHHAYVEGTNIDPDFPGINPGAASNSDIRNVPTHFIYDDDTYYNNLRGRMQTDISINVYENPVVPAGQPDPAYGLALTTFIKLVEINTITVIDNIMPGASVIVGGDYRISFRNNGPMVVGPILATSVPACFIEIERVVVKSYDVINNLKQVVIHNCNYCPPPNAPTVIATGLEYSWDTLVPAADYPTDFVIFKPPYLGIFDLYSQVLFHKSGGDYVTVIVDVEYWVTWYYADNMTGPTVDKLPYIGYTGGGKREKKIDTYTFT